MANENYNQIFTRVVTKNDTAENWVKNDPVLLKGEQGIDTTNWKIRIGDGIHKWSELSDYGLSEAEVEAQYIPISLDTVVSSDVENGTCKFSLKGTSYNGLYNPVHGSVTGKYVDIQHTLGTLKSVYDDGTVSIIDVDLFGNAENTTYGFPESRDEITESYYKRAISKDFFLKSTMEYHDNADLGITLAATNAKLHVFSIPASDFGDELPIKANNIYIHSPAFFNNLSLEDMISKTSFSHPYAQSVSMRYKEDSNTYEIYFYTHSSITKSGLLSSKMYIKYPLENPIYDYHTNKILSKKGMNITFNQESVELNAGLLRPTVSDPKLNMVALSYDIQAPLNIKAQIEGVSPLIQNINDLNYRVDNVEVQNSSVGVGDNSTDNSEIIQNFIENSVDINTNANNGLVLPSGIYRLSKTINLDKEYFTLRGEGEVIFWCNGRFPAFKIQARGVKIENIKIYLSKTEDGVLEDNDGQHSGIYIDSEKGLYDLYFKDIIIQGAYRHATKGYEYSYGIYSPPAKEGVYRYAYFNTINNVQFFSLYCGLCSQGSFAPIVGNFHFDMGKNIYNIPYFQGAAISSTENYSIGGCGYGAIINTNFNNLSFTGQFIGHDSTTPINIVYDDEKSPTKIVSATWNSLTDCAILCGGAYNTFNGFAFDVQRTHSGYYKFTNASKYNHYHTPYLNVNCGQTGMTFSETRTIKTEKGIFDYTDNFKAIYLSDFGKENKNMCPTLAQNDLLIGHGSTYSIDKNGNKSVGFPKQYGIQDNVFAYLPKHGTVKVEVKNGDVWDEVTSFWEGEPSDNVSITNIDKIFDCINYDANGFSKGVTFKQVPTETAPIRIVLTLDKPIRSIGRMIIKFNSFIAEDYDITTYMPRSSDAYSFLTRNSKNTLSQIETVFHNPQNGGTPFNINKIVITIYKGYSVENYNENGYVGLSLIYATAPDNGGYSWLPRGGGDVYGNINMGNNSLTISKTPIEDIDVINKVYVDTALTEETTARTAKDTELEEKITSLTPIITSDISTAYIFEFSNTYNNEVRLSEVSSISFTFGNGEYKQDYISGLSFDSGATPTAIDYTDSGILNWVGTDCTTADGLSIFQPSANTHYDIVFYFNGVQFIGLVNGFVPATGNVVSE